MTRARGEPSGLLKEIGHAAWRVTATLEMVGEADSALAPNSQGIERIGAPNQRKLFC